MTKRIPVIIETGKKKTFASATDWPGWARSGADEATALEALVSYAARYARIVAGAQPAFTPPRSSSAFRVVDRVTGNATTDFGAPGVPGSPDLVAVGDGDLARLRRILGAEWRVFDATVAAARGRTLRKGPRGGGRSLDAIAGHVRDAEAGYLSALGWPLKTKATGRELLEHTRAAALEGLAASARGEIARKGPRGGVRWTPRFFARRLAWHLVDHLWEIEDRASEDIG